MDFFKNYFCVFKGHGVKTDNSLLWLTHNWVWKHCFVFLFQFQKYQEIPLGLLPQKRNLWMKSRYFSLPSLSSIFQCSVRLQENILSSTENLFKMMICTPFVGIISWKWCSSSLGILVNLQFGKILCYSL